MQVKDIRLTSRFHGKQTMINTRIPSQCLDDSKKGTGISAIEKKGRRGEEEEG